MTLMPLPPRRHLAAQAPLAPAPPAQHVIELVEALGGPVPAARAGFRQLLLRFPGAAGLLLRGQGTLLILLALAREADGVRGGVALWGVLAEPVLEGLGRGRGGDVTGSF